MKTLLKSLGAVIALASALFVSGCSSSRTEMNVPSTQTMVNLNQNNYRTIKTGAVGTSYGFRLLGIIPFANPSVSKARANLYKDLGIKLEGKPVTLANTTSDRSTVYILICSFPCVTVQGDVVEFVDAQTMRAPEPGGQKLTQFQTP